MTIIVPRWAEPLKCNKSHAQIVGTVINEVKNDENEKNFQKVIDFKNSPAYYEGVGRNDTPTEDTKMTKTNLTGSQMLAQFNRDFGVHQAKQAEAAKRGPIDPDFTYEFSPVGAKASKPAIEDFDFELNPVK